VVTPQNTIDVRQVRADLIVAERHATRHVLPWLLRSLPHLPPALARGLKKKIAP